MATNSTFENLNTEIVYAKAKNRNEAISFRGKAQKTVAEEGVSVIIFFNDRYHEYLAPGHDPYVIRQSVEEFMNKPEGDSESTPSRDASGKFVSKSKATPQDKKSFFGF